VKSSRINFSRITSSGNFIPEVDGLRFVAILSVVLFHLYGFIEYKDNSFYNSSYNFNFVLNLIKNGNFGVELFFVLSGFILGLPFARYYLLNGRIISIKSYFLRRLSRLEPPYIIVMFSLLIGSIFISKNLSITDGTQSFLASIGYMHNFIYAEPSLINTVAWSLEIEIQFYILAPLLSLFFSIKNNITRRTLLIFITLFFSIFSILVTLPFLSILDYLQYFLLGFLLVDFYLIERVKNKTSILRNIFTIISFLIIFSFNEKYFNTNFQKSLWNISVLILIFFAYYNVILRKSLRFFSKRAITNVGGMCYTIYLIHFAIISFIGNPLLSIQFSSNPILNIGLYSVIILSSILLVSVVFFMLIERPCMEKNWPTKLINYVISFKNKKKNVI